MVQVGQGIHRVSIVNFQIDQMLMNYSKQCSRGEATDEEEILTDNLWLEKLEL